MAREHSNEELMEIGRKVLAQREKGKEASKERSRVKSTLYRLWKAGDRTPIGAITVSDK